MRLQRTLMKLRMFTKFSLIHRAVGLSFCLNEKEKLWKGWHRQKAGSFDLGCYDVHDVTRIAARRFGWQLERIDDLWFLERSYKGCTFYTVEKYKEPRTRNTKNWGVIFGGEGRCLEVTSLLCWHKELLEPSPLGLGISALLLGTSWKSKCTRSQVCRLSLNHSRNPAGKPYVTIASKDVKLTWGSPMFLSCRQPASSAEEKELHSFT